MKKLLLIATNTMIFLFEIIGLLLNVAQYGMGLFVYYTQLSNILAGFTSMFLIICTIRNISPQWLRFLRYLTTCYLSTTFLVVLFLFAPPDNYYNSFCTGDVLYHHLLCPILTFISFTFLESGSYIPLKNTLFSLIPTIIYGIILISLNILKIVDGPYFFLQVYMRPIHATAMWLLIILLIAYMIGFAIRSICNLFKINNMQRTFLRH